MIYVMRSAGFDDNDNLTTLIKIGYTGESSKKSRFSTYLTENPTIKVLYLIEGGDEQDERNLHKYFRHLKTNYGREWFIDSFEIIEFFNNHKTKKSLKEIESWNLSRSQYDKYRENKKLNKDKYIQINISVNTILSNLSDRRDRKKLEQYLWYHLDDFWDIIKDEFSEFEDEIKRGIESIESANIEEGNLSINELQDIYDNLVQEFNKDNNFERRMKLLCDVYFSYPTFYIQYKNSPLQTIIPLRYQNYINILGFERIKALEYKESTIISYIQSQQNLQNSNITSLFSIGSKYSKAQIKEMLREFYTNNNINKTPKATDLLDYFDLKPCQFIDKSLGKRVDGFLIMNRKGDVL